MKRIFPADCIDSLPAERPQDFLQSRADPGSLFKDGSQFPKDRRLLFCPEIGARSFSPSLQEADFDQGSEFTLQAGGSSSERLSQFGEVPPLERNSCAGRHNWIRQ